MAENFNCECRGTGFFSVARNLPLHLFVNKVNQLIPPLLFAPFYWDGRPCFCTERKRNIFSRRSFPRWPSRCSPAILIRFPWRSSAQDANNIGFGIFGPNARHEILVGFYDKFFCRFCGYQIFPFELFVIWIVNQPIIILEQVNHHHIGRVFVEIPFAVGVGGSRRS